MSCCATNLYVFMCTRGLSKYILSYIGILFIGRQVVDLKCVGKSLKNIHIIWKKPMILLKHICSTNVYIFIYVHNRYNILYYVIRSLFNIIILGTIWMFLRVFLYKYYSESFHPRWRICCYILPICFNVILDVYCENNIL